MFLQDKQIYQVELKYKRSRILPENSYETMTVDKLFWANWLNSQLVQGIDFKVEDRPDGWKIIYLHRPLPGRMAIYQETIDKDSRTNKARLSNNKSLTLKLSEAKSLDKVILEWEQCSCADSAVYQAHFTYLTDTDQEPVYVQFGSLGVI